MMNTVITKSKFIFFRNLHVDQTTRRGTKLSKVRNNFSVRVRSHQYIFVFATIQLMTDKRVSLIDIDFGEQSQLYKSHYSMGTY